MYAYAHAMADVWRSEDNLRKQVLSFHHAGHEDQTHGQSWQLGTFTQLPNQPTVFKARKQKPESQA